MIRKYILLIILTLSFAIKSNSQPGDPGGGGNPGDVPISGIEVLLIIGSILGVKRLINNKR